LINKQVNKLVSRIMRRFSPYLRVFRQPRQYRKWQEFSIGIYKYKSLLEYTPYEQVDNPVLTREHISDVPAAFVADPFMLHVNDTWYMFFEVMNKQSHKGEIGLAISQDALKWYYQSIIISEPFHLSYPYVFQWMHSYYMIPESYQAGTIRLYKALDFPDKWIHITNLLSGRGFLDTSIFVHDNLWWLYTETNPDHLSGTLRLYYAETLFGPWHEHPQSPIVQGRSTISRPAGRVFMVGGRVFRVAQNCVPAYGSQVRLYEVTRLTITDYDEQEIGGTPLLTGSGFGWNASGMHHIDIHHIGSSQWIACVDGFQWR
jgi:hypothetical protein